MHRPVPDTPKVGVLVPPHIPPRQLVSYAQQAEQLGFSEVWVAEDCFLHGAFAQAATILASTTSVQVGMGFEAGFTIVLLAIILDRISRPKEREVSR